MRSAKIVRAAHLVGAISALALAACGGGSDNSSPKAYEGQWLWEPPAAKTSIAIVVPTVATVLNLRWDGTFSEVFFHTALNDYGDFSAQKGTYIFTPDVVGDDTKGTLTLTITHQYSGSSWVAVEPGSVSGACTITAGTPNTMTFNGLTFDYYHAEIAIPITYPVPIPT